MEWLGELSCNVLFEDKFSASRAMHYMSQELPSPPPPEVERPADGNEDGPPDFGNMGWRFCHEPIQKVKHPIVVLVRARSVLFLRNFHLQFTLFRISLGK